MPAIVGDDYLDFLTRVLLMEVVAQALCAFAKRIFVDPVGARSHDAAHATRAKFQVFVEPVLQLIGVLGHQVLYFFLDGRVEEVGKPAFCGFQDAIRIHRISFGQRYIRNPKQGTWAVKTARLQRKGQVVSDILYFDAE